MFVFIAFIIVPIPPASLISIWFSIIKMMNSSHENALLFTDVFCQIAD